MKVWASKNSIVGMAKIGKNWVKMPGEGIADVPEGWLDRFAAAQPDDIRKFGDSRNCTMVYRVSAICEAIEQRKYFRTDTEEANDKEVA